nr:integrase, catalytic region, zinc finger, CCHC-type, peptidase aspartic, catalytic [Tanacetum cinerariifolium]
MMKGSDIGEQEKKAKLFNEWEKFTSTAGESIESYYHHFMQLMNDLKRNKHLTENIAANLKFLNNLQPEWKRHNGGNQNGLVVVPGIANHSGTGNIVAARAEGDLDKIEEVNVSCILMGNLQHASTSGTQLDKAPVCDKDGSAEYRASGGTIETSSSPNEETHAHQETVYHNLVDQVAHVNMVNCNMRATNAELKSKLARYKIQEQRIEISQEKYDKLESLYNGNVLLEERDPPAVYDLEETLELAQESREKMRFLKKEIKPANFAKINHLSGVKEELFLSNVSNMVTVSKTISIPNEDLLDDTTPSVAQKFLNEVKSSFVTLQFDARVQNFKIQYLQEVAKFVRDFKSLAKEDDESLDKKKYLELKIERLLKASVSRDIMSIVQNSFVDVPSDLKTELDHTKEKLELCIIKKEIEYAVEWLQAQLRDLKSKSSDTSSTSNTLDPLNQKLESKIVELEFQVNTSESLNNTSGTSVTPHVDKPKLIVVAPHSKKLHASILSHSVPQPKEFNVMKHRNVIAPGMFKINPSQTSRVDLVPNKQSSASIRTNPITKFQRRVTFKEKVSSDTVNTSSIGLVHTARTRRPQPKGNTRNARVPSASKSSEVNKNVTVEDHRSILLLSKNQKTMSSECNNIKLSILNDKSEIYCGTCKQCLVTVNHDACLLSPVNALNSRSNNLCANASPSANQKRHRTQVVQICLWCIDSGCSKHMTGNIKLLINFMWKFLGTVHFGNDHIAAILGYGDLKWENSTIIRVYFVEGLGHNLFLVGQFCDADLEVTFRRNSCFIRDLDGVDLLKGSRSTNLYNINLYDMA